MYLVIEYNSWREMCNIWKAETEEEAQNFADYKTYIQGVYGEYEYSIYNIEQFETIPTVTLEETKEAKEFYEEKTEELQERFEQIKLESTEKLNVTPIENMFKDCKKLDVTNWFK